MAPNQEQLRDAVDQLCANAANKAAIVATAYTPLTSTTGKCEQQEEPKESCCTKSETIDSDMYWYWPSEKDEQDIYWDWSATSQVKVVLESTSAKELLQPTLPVVRALSDAVVIGGKDKEKIAGQDPDRSMIPSSRLCILDFGNRII